MTSRKLAFCGGDQTLRLAAEELRAYLTRMDPQAELVLLETADYDPSLPETLWLLTGGADAPRVPDPAWDDGILLEVEACTGRIVGTNPGSVLIGVYRLLRECGVRFLKPGTGGELVPALPLTAVSARVRETPSCRHRGVCIEGSISQKHAEDMIRWLPKLGLNEYYIQFFTPYTFFDRWYNAKNPLREKHPITETEADAICRRLEGEIKRRGMRLHRVGHGWTCDPFGIPGNTWDPQAYDIPPETRAHLAQVDGKRELWGGIPLNTNLCWGDSAVRTRVAQSIADFCQTHPQADAVHIWLADGANNHCECPLCRDTLPSDFYIRLLNEADALLTARGLSTRLVFLIYVDLLWEPQTETLRNPDRFLLMFAPITRTYTKPFLPDAAYDGPLAPYDRNRNVMPVTVEENVARLRRWQAQFAGDSFDFDYHLMWDHLSDPGYYECARILHEDMKNLPKLGLNGMVSCQLNRCFFPNALPMHAMAAALWDSDSDFDRVARDYFDAAYGEDAPAAQAYLSRLSQLSDPPYARHERPAQSPETAARTEEALALLDAFRPTAERNLLRRLPAPRRRHWQALLDGQTVTRAYLRLLHLRAIGADGVRQAADETVDAGNRLELLWPEDFDQYEFSQRIYNQILELQLEL